MDAGESWRVISCSQQKTIINPILLRFRPIAPKPVCNGSSSGGDWKPENENSLVNSVRTKRKYVRAKKRNEYYNQRRRKNNKSPASQSQSPSSDLGKVGDKTPEILTLQLLPEKTVDLVKDASGSHVQDMNNTDLTSASFDNRKKVAAGDLSCCLSVEDLTVFETVVTVESVTDTCMEDEVYEASTDAERMNNLEKDTCPGFISDGSCRVQWVNEAYKKMMMVRPENEGQFSVEKTVRLVIKEKVSPYLNCPAFTCWVRLQYTWHKERYSQMVPCDVWKMSFGGFAWRLDVKTALSLGGL